MASRFRPPSAGTPPVPSSTGGSGPPRAGPGDPAKLLEALLAGLRGQPAAPTGGAAPAGGAAIPPLSPEEVERYGRQVILPEWGAKGQDKIAGATVAVTGVGPAAEAAILYLAAAGVGRIISQAFSDRIRPLNPHVQVAAFPGDDVAGVSVAVRTATATIVADDERSALGAAVAVEALKAILGRKPRTRVSLPRLMADEEEEAA